MDNYTNEIFNYQSIDKFTKKNKKKNLNEFSNYLSTNLDLYLSFSIENVDKIDLLCDQIISSIPYIKQIFKKPFIVLNFQDEVLNVEKVKRMNSNTFSHLSRHIELINSFDNNKIKPKKLLSKIYIDDYTIYENKVFTILINQILLMISKRMSFLKDFISLSNRFNTNFYDSSYHKNYFLALGFLRMSYLRSQNKNYQKIKDLIGKMDYILKIIQPRLKKTVYKENNKHLKSNNIKLKRTNLFYHDKNYSKIYILFKYMKDNELIETKLPKFKLEQAYSNYVLFLLHFAITNFDFKPIEDVLDVNSPNIHYELSKFKLNLYKNNSHFTLEFKYGIKRYKINLYLENYENNINDNEDNIILTKFPIDYFSSNKVYISINNIDSFRRLQQIILKGMIYSQNKFSICPYCQNGLFQKHKDYYFCPFCKLEIQKVICPTTKKPYFITSLYNKKELRNIDTNYLEARYNFKNITKIDKEGNFICPCCNNIHKIED